MSTTTSISEQRGAATARAWGARARDWGETEAPAAAHLRGGDPPRRHLLPGQTVLDVGCGTGVFLRAAADHGAAVCGLDASAALLEIARERVPEADLCQGDLAAAPLRRRQLRRRLRLQLVLLRRRHGRGAARGGPRRQARRARRDPGVRAAPRRFDIRHMKDVLARFSAAAGRAGRARPRPRCGSPARSRRSPPRRASSPSRAFDVRWAFEYADEAALTRGDDVGGRLRRDRRPRAPGRRARRDRRGARGLPHARRRLPARERVALPDRPRRGLARLVARTRRRRGYGR